MKFKSFLLTIVLQLLAWLAFYIYTGGNDWLTEKMCEIIFSIVIFIFTVLLGTISFLYRPINIMVKQGSSIWNTKETAIHIQNNEVKTIQDQRTITFTLIMERRGSLWWYLFKKLLKKNNVYLSFQSIPPNIGLSPNISFGYSDSSFETNEYQGFNLKLNEYFNYLYRSSKEPSFEEEFEYIIIVHPDFYKPINSVYPIEPMLVIKNTNKTFLVKISAIILKLLLKFDFEDHNVRISKR